MTRYKCPKCSSTSLEVVVEVRADEWDDNSLMTCNECGHDDIAEEFSYQTCDGCGNECKFLVGCPNGNEVCRTCFDAGSDGPTTVEPYHA